MPHTPLLGCISLVILLIVCSPQSNTSQLHVTISSNASNGLKLVTWQLYARTVAQLLQKFDFQGDIFQNLQSHVTLLAEGEIQTVLTACKNKNVNLELK